MRKLRGFVSLALVVALVMSCASAMAAAWVDPKIDIHTTRVYENSPKPIYKIYGNGTTYDWWVERVDPKTGKSSIVDTTDDGYFYAKVDATGDMTIYWDFYAEGDQDPSFYYPNGIGIVHRLIVRDSTGKRQVHNFFVDWSTKTVTFDNVRAAGWMWNNTVCSFGPHFWDYTDKTNKWYMFTPVDLSTDGVQSFEMVAGGMYKIGYVYVAVEGDNVTVTYEYVNPTEIYNQGEFFTLLPDLDTPEVIDPDQMESMVYGQTYSIANDLGGDTSMLLFTCNRVNFLNSTTGIERFYENIKWRADLRQQMVDFAGITPLE